MSTLAGANLSAVLTRTVTDARRAIQFGIFGGIGGVMGGLIGELVHFDSSASFITSIVETGGWFGIIGACIAITLLAGQASYLRRGWQLRELAKGGVPCGFLAGAVAGAIAQGVYGGVGATEALRVICWGIAGGLLGYGLSFRIPNLGHRHGLVGGAVGGVLGGCLFILCATKLSDDFPGRVVGLTAVGFSIGLMVALIEAALREAWLEISYGPKEIRTISLGPQPVSIGGDVGACTIYAHNAPPIAVRYTLQEGRILCEDVVAARTESVSPGDCRVIGNVTVTVRASRRTSAQGRTSVTEGNASHGIAAQPAPVTAVQIKSFVLRLASGRTIPLREGVRVSGKDIPSLEALAGDGVVAEIVAHPQDPTILGLKNLSHRSCMGRYSCPGSTPDGRVRA